VDHDPAAGSPPHVPIRPEDGAALEVEPVATAAAVEAGRAANPRVCSFLRALDDGDRLTHPIEAPDPANRCTALREAVPQSLRQQELVCLTSGHVNCPRYLRGVLIAEPPPPVRTERAAPVNVTPATAGALAIFAVAFLVSVAFVVVNGGLALTAVAATPALSGGVLGAVESPPPTPGPTAAPTLQPTPAPTATATAAPAATATSSAPPAPLPSPSAEITPVPTAAPTATPASNRYALLTACPDRSGCWIYRIRSGDNLYSIANYFGVSLKTIQAWNAWTATGLSAGRELRIPTPTR